MRQSPHSDQSWPSTVGDRIRFARLQAGLTQEALGEASGTSRSMVAHWETGVRNPGVRSLEALCAPLNITLEWLIAGREPQAESPGVKPLVPASATPTVQSFNEVLLRAATEVVIEIFRRRRLKMDPEAIGKAVSLVYEIGALKGLDRPKVTIQMLKRSLSEDAEKHLRGA